MTSHDKNQCTAAEPLDWLSWHPGAFGLMVECRIPAKQKYLSVRKMIPKAIPKAKENDHEHR